jgi:hypothetical protein
MNVMTEVSRRSVESLHTNIGERIQKKAKAVSFRILPYSLTTIPFPLHYHYITAAVFR